MFCKPKKAHQVDARCVEYLDGLYGYAVVLSGNRADAEDLVQETYVRAMQPMGRLRMDSNTKTWFFTILRNIWVNQLRKRRSSPRIVVTCMGDGFANEIGGPAERSYDLYVSNREREQVRAAIQDLPVDFREVIVLRDCEELSFQEIGSIVGCPAQNVKAQLARARSMLCTVLSAKLKKCGPSYEEREDETVRWQ